MTQEPTILPETYGNRSNERPGTGGGNRTSRTPNLDELDASPEPWGRISELED